MTTRIQLDRKKVAEFCRIHRVARLSFFGSVLRQDFGPESDVDLLVEFEPGSETTLFDMAAMERELTELFGRKVDLRTPRELSPFFRERVLGEAETVYAEG